jgi:hypothetical protein
VSAGTEVGTPARAAAAPPPARAGRLGVERNELLTVAAASVLTILLLAEGVTLLDMRGLIREHMFIGLVLVPPVLLKLGSTGYRFARYYTGSPVYREKGPPRPLLRLLAPVLVASTATIFASGVWLLLLGHHSDFALAVHKLAFIVWSGVFGLHFLAYLPAVARSLAGMARGRRAGARSPGSRIAAALALTFVGAGLVVAIELLSRIDAWHGRWL